MSWAQGVLGVALVCLHASTAMPMNPGLDALSNSGAEVIAPLFQPGGDVGEDFKPGTGIKAEVRLEKAPAEGQTENMGAGVTPAVGGAGEQLMPEALDTEPIAAPAAAGDQGAVPVEEPADAQAADAAEEEVAVGSGEAAAGGGAVSTGEDAADGQAQMPEEPAADAGEEQQESNVHPELADIGSPGEEHDTVQQQQGPSDQQPIFRAEGLDSEVEGDDDDEDESGSSEGRKKGRFTCPPPTVATTTTTPASTTTTAATSTTSEEASTKKSKSPKRRRR